MKFEKIREKTYALVTGKKIKGKEFVVIFKLVGNKLTKDIKNILIDYAEDLFNKLEKK